MDGTQVERLKVLVVDSNLAHHREALEAAVSDVADVAWLPVGASGVEAHLREVDVLVSQKFTPAWADAAPRLRAILAPGAGHDGIDKTAVGPGVVVANTFHHAASIAEYVVATAVIMRRGLALQDKALRSGQWASSVYQAGIPQAPTLASARVGIVGYGSIGQATWRALAALGASGAAVSWTPRHEAPDGLAWFGGLDALPRLLTESDLVVVALPLTPETEHLFGAAELDLIGPAGLLVNVARGPLVEPHALYDALKTGRLGGAVLDVWYAYPSDGDQADPAPVPLGELPNVFMTPHVAGVTTATFAGRAADVAANIRRLAMGEPLDSVVSVGAAR